MLNCELFKSNKIKKITLSIILVCIFSLGVVNLIATNLLATEGVKVSQISDQTAFLVKENQYLSNMLSRSKSLAQIEAKALELGFSRVAQVATIGSFETVAQLPLR